MARPPLHAALARFLPDDIADADRQRQARIVVACGLIASGAYALLLIALVATGLWVSVGLALVSLAATAAGLALVRSGRIEHAAVVVTVTAVLTPIAQAAVDAGARDPALALIALAPLAAAMMSGLRLAFATLGLGVLGTSVLFGLHVAGVSFPNASSGGDLLVYAYFTVLSSAVLSALAGVLYVRDTRHAIDAAELAATRLDEALQESEERYRSLFEHVPIGVYRTSGDGRILMVNQTILRMLCVDSVDEARQINANDLYVDPRDRDFLLQRLVAEGVVRRFETRWRAPAGEVRDVRLDARASFDDGGAVLYIDGTIEDVTTERRALQALRENEAWFKALVQRTSDVIVVVGSDGRLVYSSPSVEDLLGLPAAEVVGELGIGFVHPDDRDGILSSIRAAGRVDGATSQIELRLRHDLGHDIHVEGVATALFHDPAVRGLVVNLRDITERQRAQAALVHAKRQAEEVVELKSTFIANMSHELRTPLTAILGFSDVLSDVVSDPDHLEFVGLISRGGRRLMDTLNSVLDLTRLEAGRGEITCVPTDLGEAVQEAVDLLQPVADGRGLALTADVPEGARAAIDEGAFTRVLNNLVGNALKFTKDGGVTISVRATEREVLVAVADTGIGISPEFLPRLFGEFEQESQGVERTHEGAGLGLAISKKLVERMNGTLSVESEQGVGTTFTIALPRVEAEDATADQPAILVVDDNEHARLVAERVVGDQYHCVAVDSAAAAFEALRQRVPDVVLLDIHLGASASGEDVMRRLRAIPATANLPIVAMTAYAITGDRARFLSAGFDEYVTKPYTRDDLLDALARARADRQRGDGQPTMLVRNRDAAPSAPSLPAVADEA